MQTNRVQRSGGLTGKIAVLSFGLAVLLPSVAAAQAYGEPDRGSPGDAMIQEYLRLETQKIEAGFPGTNQTAEERERSRPQFREEYFDMLGLWPLPEKTPLQPVVTRTLDRGDYLVDMVHYQSRPGLYVTGNMYRPAKVDAGSRLPGVLYVCGHSPRPRNGNKTAYQSHGIWLARHGYVCLVLDTLEMGEITCTHHGTYREGRWWWLSRGYTPAGVECWNGLRGIDYLTSLPFVDPERIGVTGISGGGAATVWISAADERVKVSVPVSGWSDLLAHVPNRVVNGHCDCMFNYNIYQWPFAKVLGMVAPRPLLFINSDADSIFPMDGNERIINRLERLYSVFGAGELVDSVVSVGGHAYRKDIRQSAFCFLNSHLKGDPGIPMDTEVDLVTSSPREVHPIPPEQLRVFAKDEDFPKDAINPRIDYEFVSAAKPELPGVGQFDSWKSQRLARLRQLSFHHFPDRVPAAVATQTDKTGIVTLRTENAIDIRLRPARSAAGKARRVWLYITGADVSEAAPAWLNDCAKAEDAVFICEPRGIGASRWTTKNPPNYVERSLYLLGRTADSGRVWDIAAAARYLAANENAEICVAGAGSAGVLAGYTALIEPSIGALVISEPPASHMDSAAPALLGVLRVIDIPQAIGMVAPRPVTLIHPTAGCAQAAKGLFTAAGAAAQLSVR